MKLASAEKLLAPMSFHGKVEVVVMFLFELVTKLKAFIQVK